MQISTVLDHVDSGHMALPQFQRGFVWNRDQVRGPGPGSPARINPLDKCQPS